MSSSAENIIETIDFMNANKGKKWGLIKVVLYRPWSTKHFLAKLPKSVKRVSVIDKTREEGASGNPMYLDVVSTIYQAREGIKVVGGSYGIASKNFNPDSILAIYKDLESPNPKNGFTVGINDDVTHTSLKVELTHIRMTSKK